MFDHGQLKTIRFLDLSESTRFLIDQNPHPILLIEIPSLRILDANASAENLFGYVIEELREMDYWQLRNKSRTKEANGKGNTNHHSQLNKLNFKRDIKNYYDLSRKVFRAEENWHQLLDMGSNIFLLQLNPLQADRKHFEFDQQSLSFLSENSFDMIWKMDLRMKFIYTTPSVENLFGYKVEEWTGSHIYNHCSRSEFIKIARLALSAIKNYKKFSSTRFETKFKHKDGRLIPVEIIGKLLRNKYGLPIGFQGTTRDITERNKARKQIADEKAQLLCLINNLPDRIYFKDTKSRFIIANQALADHIGVKNPSSIIGKTDADLYPKNLAAQYIQDERKIMQTKEPLINYEERAKNPDGSIGWSLTSKIPIQDENGVTIGLVGIGRDVTKAKQIQEELMEAKELAERSSRLKDSFIANVSHEIRTPLNAILGFSTLIFEEYKETGKIESDSYFKIIGLAGERLLRTVEMILNLSRIKTGEFNLKVSKVDIHAIISQLEKEYSPRAIDKNLNLTFELKTDIQFIYTDEYSFEHCVSNLIDNAIKYTHSGFVSIKIEDFVDHGLKVSVQDSGIGIAEEYLPILFEPYSQEEDGDARSYEGIGLGLSLTHNLIHLIKGEIDVKSEKGKGSLFTLYFPNLS